MRINPANTPAISGTETKGADSAKKTKKTGYDAPVSDAAAGKKSESVSTDISSKAKEMAHAKKIAEDTPDVREAKIAELREKIQNKKYNVSASDIADRMVDDHIRMAGA